MTIDTWQHYHHTLRDRLGTDRFVSVAMLTSLPTQPTVLFCTDGQVVETLSRRLSAEESRNLPILIGVHSNEATRESR